MTYKKMLVENKEKKMQENFQKLVEGVKKTTADPEEYKRFLDFASKIPTYSFNNQILIYNQNENASYVAGLKTWNFLGRKVNMGVKALKIIAPIIAKEIERDENTKEEIEKNVIKGYRNVNVFDVSDTNGIPLLLNPIVPKNVTESEFAKKLYEPVIEEFRKDLPVILDKNYKHSSNGMYYTLEHKIVLNDKEDRDITNKLKTLIHELSHSIFHNDSGKYYMLDKETKELQAKSTAYLVCKSFGMDTSEYSFPYIKRWAASQDEKLLLKYQDDIQKESAAIVKRIEDVIVQREITFDVPVVLQENVSSVSTGEEKLTLIQYGDNYTIAVGDVKESSLNNLASIKALGPSYGDRKLAEDAFELTKGHIALSKVEQMDKNKGNIHIYRRELAKSNEVRCMYLVGISSLTDIKAITSLSPDLKAIEKEFKKVLNVHQKIEMNLSTRDRDGDGLTDFQERKLGTNLVNHDTDSDGVPDNLDRNARIPNRPLQVNKELEVELSL